MQITDVTFMRRKNLGNYEHEEISLTAKVDEGESAEKVLNNLDNTLRKQLGLPLVEVAAEVEKCVAKMGKAIAEAIEPTKKKVTKKVTKKKVAKKVIEPEVVEEEKPAPTFDELMVEMRAFCKVKGVNAAKILLKDFGVAKAAELKEEQYLEVMEKVVKCLAK